jgi:hypothetical protein
MPEQDRIRTVIVTGAGASAEYGLPVSETLRSWVVGTSTPTEFQEMLDRIWSGANPSTMVEFRTARKELGRSNSRTLDEFLTDDVDVQWRVRRSIGAVLAPLEASAIARDDYNGGWHMMLSRALHRYEASKWRDSCQIVTFNYDRVLAHQLATAAATSYRMEATFVASHVNQLTTHVYGCLPTHYGWDSQSASFLCHTLNEVELKHISLMNDRRSLDHAATRARNLLSRAENVFFLGFSFDEINCRRIGLAPEGSSRVSMLHPGARVFATGMGLNERDRVRLASYCGSRELDIGEYKEPCSEFLRRVEDKFMLG